MLTDQVISKLLNFKNLPVQKNPAQKDNETIQLPQEDVYSGKQAARITKSKVLLIVIAWTILALTVCAVVGKVGFQLKFPLSFGAIERTNGYLIHTGILVLAACVLGLTTWLYSKNKIRGFTIVVVIIGTILSVSLPLLTIQSGNTTYTIGDVKKSEATFSPPFSSPLSLPPSSLPLPHAAVVVDVVVSGILYSEDNPTVLIGPRIVHEGEIVGEIRVIKVHKDKVVFEMNGRRWTQTVGETSKRYRQ